MGRRISHIQQASKGLEHPSVHTCPQPERATLSIRDRAENGRLSSVEVCGFHPLWVTGHNTVLSTGVSCEWWETRCQWGTKMRQHGRRAECHLCLVFTKPNYILGLRWWPFVWQQGFRLGGDLLGYSGFSDCVEDGGILSASSRAHTQYEEVWLLLLSSRKHGLAGGRDALN